MLLTLNQESLARYLHTPFQYHASVDSTNDLARAWLIAGAPSGAVVIADEQRRGRGRMGRTWYTPPGVALAMSVVLHPSATMLNQMSMLGALAIAELCESLDIESTRIKWPNDVLIGGKKVSGVLPEAIWQDDRLLGVVLGMGVNVKVDFDDALSQIAINMGDVLTVLPERAMLISQLLDRVHYWAAKLGQSVTANALYDAWFQRLETIGRSVTIGGISGIVDTVEPDGTLIVRDSGGHAHRIIAGELRYITEQFED